MTNKQTLLYTQTMEISSASSDVNQNLSNERFWDWRTAILAIALVEIAGARLAATEWAGFLYFTQTMGFAGVVLGLALGVSRFSRQTVIRLSAGYTLLLLPVQLLLATERTGWLWQDIMSLLGSLFISLDQIIKNRPVYDPLFFISIVTIIFWIIGLSAGYWLTRHGNFLNVVLPPGLAMLIVQAFDPAESGRVWELAVFIFTSLLLLGRIYFLKNHSFWKKTNFLISDEAVNDLERGALTITAIAVFIAWSLPGWISNVKPAAQAWRDFSQPIFEEFSNAVSALDSPYAGSNAGGNFYGDSLALGQQAATGDTRIFTVKVKENTFMPIRNYWRGRVYDFYSDGHWTTTSNSSGLFVPDSDELTVEYPNERHIMEYTFTNSAKKQSLLYAPAETIWVSKSANIISTSNADGVKDVTAWVATKSLSSGSQYRVRALLADPSIEELRASGTEYPAWVTDRYLQIPADMEAQLRELTLGITAPYDTVYDKVNAVTSYLRKEIKYDTKITQTPKNNKDPLLWVLFDTKNGFCMYYASAEALMLRSIGIPARMAVGFVEGNYDEATERYDVAYKDSHAWPEVYFAGIGWVTFEPTSSQDPIERPETKTKPNNQALNSKENLTGNPLADNAADLSGKETDIFSAENKINLLYRNILISMVCMLTFGFGIFMLRRYAFMERLLVYLANQYKQNGNISPRWIRWASLSPIERAFQAINLSLFWLGHPQPAHSTSQIRAEILISQLPLARDQILSLLHEYETTIYTPRAGNIGIARKAAIGILLKTWQIRVKETLKFLDTRYNQLK